MKDLFGTGAPPTSDLVVLVELALGAALIAGMFLVRRGHVRLHAYLQSSVVLVNIPIVLAWMVPQYQKNVLPLEPGYLNEPFYLVPTVMLFVGLAAEILGVYVILVAGTNWLPERLRFRRYKLVMRTVLGLWWSVLVIGIATYYAWYVAPYPN